MVVREVKSLNNDDEREIFYPHIYQIKQMSNTYRNETEKKFWKETSKPRKNYISNLHWEDEEVGSPILPKNWQLKLDVIYQ